MCIRDRSPSNTKSPGLRPTSIPNGILMHPAISPNRNRPKIREGALPPFWGGGTGSRSNTVLPGPRPTYIPSGVLIHPAIWPQQIWAENWGAVPLWGKVRWVPSNTMWPGPRPICMPSFILIHPTIRPQLYTNITDKTDRTMDR